MADTDSGLLSYFQTDHRRCDALWAELEAIGDEGDVAVAKERWATFSGAMRRHFRMEEEVMFPAFQEATGMFSGGPVAVMKMEHEQMRALLTPMDSHAANGDVEALLDHGDTLLMVIQQHNAKEEGILYPMAEQTLASQWVKLAPTLEAIEPG